MLEYVGDQKVCQKCFYWRGFNSTAACCDYIGVTGSSRCFKNGKRRLEPDYCDKFEPRKRKYG